MSGISLIIALTVLLLLWPFFLLAQATVQKTASPIVTIHNTPSSIRKLLDPPSAKLADLLAARATPNERLIRVFSLTNTFVSPDPIVHNTFIARASSILRAAKRRGWHHFQQVIVDAVEASLPHDAAGRDFDSFIQDITLRVALVGLLEVNTSVTDFQAADINAVTMLITLLWSLSKTQ